MRQECPAPNKATGTDARRAGSRGWDRDDEILPIQAEFIDYDHRMLGTRLTTGRRAHRGYRYSMFLRWHLCLLAMRDVKETQ